MALNNKDIQQEILKHLPDTEVIFYNIENLSQWGNVALVSHSWRSACEDYCRQRTQKRRGNSWIYSATYELLEADISRLTDKLRET